MFAEMGFDAVFFARIDYRDKEQRRDSKTLQVPLLVIANKLCFIEVLLLIDGMGRL